MCIRDRYIAACDREQAGQARFRCQQVIETGVELLFRDPGRLLREVPPGSAAVEPTLVLSNGRYNVSLRANGAGCSRWGEIGINRWRDDGLRDAHGSFFYLRRSPQQRPVSVTLHPAPDPGAHYHCTFHADRACFDACLLYTSPSPRDRTRSRMPSSA